MTSIARTNLTPPSALTPAARARRGRAAKRWLRYAVWSLAVLVAAGALVAALWPKPVLVDVAAVVRGDLVVAVEEVARTRVRDRYVVSAPVSGALLRSELRAGDRVEQSAIVARITPLFSPMLDARTKAEAGARSAAAAAAERQARTAVARAEAAAQFADEDLDKARRLVAGGSLAEEAVKRAALEARLRAEELASARFGAQTAAHEAAMARAALARESGLRGGDSFDVPAPAPGSVLRVLSPNAGPVAAGAPLLEIGDPDALEVVTEVLSADAVRIRPGAAVRLERWGGPELRAHVRRVEPAGFTRLSALGVEEQRVPVIVDLDEPRESWDALGDGYRVEATIVLEERRAVLRAPLGAVFRHGDGWAVYTVDGDRARVTPVALGARSSSEVEIAGGLAEAARVLVHPSERVKDGVPVRAR